MEQADSAEKEASVVLHSLLSVERVEKVEKKDINQTGTFITTTENGQEVQWTTAPIAMAHTLFTGMADGSYEQCNDQVIWEEAIANTTKTGSLCNNDIVKEVNECDPTEEFEEEELEIIDERKSKPKVPIRRPKVKSLLKKKKKSFEGNTDPNDPTKLETSAAQVKERFRRACECQDESCFMGLNPETVYKHRLNIAELTKAEHDMYLMGVTMACLANPDTTVRQKERRRLRAQYVYQGRRVCLDAFLYLENCTHYQLKRIRKHVMTHGVAPRVHGNHGKKPHNTFSLDIYRHATEFLKQYMEQHTGGAGICNSKQPIQLPWDVTRKHLHDAYKEYGQILEPGIKLMGYSTFRHFMKEQFPHVKFSKVEPKPSQISTPASQPPQVQNESQSEGESNQTNLQAPLAPIQIHVQSQPQAVTLAQTQNQDQTQMQMHVQPTPSINSTQASLQGIQAIKQVIQPSMGVSVNVGMEAQNIQIQECVISNDNTLQQVIPLVVAPNDSGSTHPQAYIVTPVPQIISNGNLAHASATANTFSFLKYNQLTNGFVINEQGNIVTAMSNTQHTPFTFSRI